MRRTGIALLVVAAGTFGFSTLATEPGSTDPMPIATVVPHSQASDTSLSGDPIPTALASQDVAPDPFSIRVADEPSHQPDRTPVHTSGSKSAARRNGVAPDHSRMSAGVAKLASSGESRLVDVIVSYNDEAELDAIITLGGELRRKFSRLKIQTVRIPADALGELSHDAGIDFISLDAPVMTF